MVPVFNMAPIVHIHISSRLLYLTSRSDMTSVSIKHFWSYYIQQSIMESSSSSSDYFMHYSRVYLYSWLHHLPASPLPSVNIPNYDENVIMLHYEIIFSDSALLIPSLNTSTHRLWLLVILISGVQSISHYNMHTHSHSGYNYIHACCISKQPQLICLLYVIWLFTTQNSLFH